jgi:hypothetical protein
MINKETDFVFYKNKQFFSSFPAITQLPNNQLLLIFRRTRDVRWLLDDNDEEAQQLKQQVDHIDSRSQLVAIKLDQSLNQASTLQTLTADPEAADQDASLLLLQNGHILLSSFSWYPLPGRVAHALQSKGARLAGSSKTSGCYFLMWGSFVRISRDMGETWSAHQYLPQLPNAADILKNRRTVCSAANRGQVIEVGDEILLPVYLTLDNHTSDSCHLYVSKDNGFTWNYRSMIAIDDEHKMSFCEPSLLHCDGNKIIAFMRVFGDDHLKDRDQLYTASSFDNGRTWQPWCKKALTGHPTHPLKLKDGRILLTYGYRHKPYGIRARLMDKNAEQFVSGECILRSDAICGDVGYPWAVQLENGKVLIVYYYTREDGIRHIAGTTIRID